MAEEPADSTPGSFFEDGLGAPQAATFFSLNATNDGRTTAVELTVGPARVVRSFPGCSLDELVDVIREMAREAEMFRPA
jgi:hypothetical protein